MSICTYTTDSGYYYCIEIGQPEHQVCFGQGSSPEAAALDMSGTQYQSADFSCRCPSPKRLAECFNLDIDDEDEGLEYGSDEDDAAAEAAIAGAEEAEGDE